MKDLRDHPFSWKTEHAPNVKTKAMISTMTKNKAILSSSVIFFPYVLFSFFGQLLMKMVAQKERKR
jgi:hypothetical protein